ncbi:MAG: hypothetical protein ACI88A_004874 [Paraglaciecola sp.]|jgi:uncharacterized protein (DUF885 family)
MWKRPLLLGTLLMGVCFHASATEGSKLSALLEKIWQYQLSVDPIKATKYGQNQYNDQLKNLSVGALKAKNLRNQQFLQQLSQLNEAKLSHQQKISKIMQARELKNAIDLYRFNAHYMPITSESGFYSALAFLPASVPLKTVQDYQDYLARLSQFPRYFAEQIAWMKKGLATGRVQPTAVLVGFDKTIKNFITKTPQDSQFFEPFKHLATSGFTARQQASLFTQGQAAVNQSVLPAYQAFYDFLVAEYIPDSKQDIAASTWQKGAEFYQNRSDYYTSTTLAVADIHTTGLHEVKRIRSEMQNVVDTLNFDGNINQFIEHLRTSSEFYAKSADELLMRASYIAKRIDATLPRFFYTLPRIPYGVAPVPDNIAPKYTTGRYIAPTRNDQPGYYWVNTYALDKRPLYSLPALTLHEAVPGHHLQISLASEMQDLPPMRRYTYISAFGEGWGLYSEFLGKEMGIYTTPYEEFGRLSYEMWRACRLVVDTGMHTQGWSRQQAIDYMLENTALSEHNVTTEVDRYISWPAQALSYKIGEMTIKRLRKKAEQALGNKFDLRAFHDAVLEYGSVPLAILEENIQTFIDKNKGR